MCDQKGIQRSEEMKLVLAPDFIIMDLDCIEEGDRVILKSMSKVMPLGHYREL
jgi:hypothetical protein